MAGIKQPIQDVLAKLATLTVTNADGQTLFLYTRIWNEQPKFEEDGHGTVYPKPAAFVEVVNKAEYKESRRRVPGLRYRMAGTPDT